MELEPHLQHKQWWLTTKKGSVNIQRWQIFYYIKSKYFTLWFVFNILYNDLFLSWTFFVFLLRINVLFSDVVKTKWTFYVIFFSDFILLPRVLRHLFFCYRCRCNATCSFSLRYCGDPEMENLAYFSRLSVWISDISSVCASDNLTVMCICSQVQRFLQIFTAYLELVQK